MPNKKCEHATRWVSTSLTSSSAKIDAKSCNTRAVPPCPQVRASASATRAQAQVRAQVRAQVCARVREQVRAQVRAQRHSADDEFGRGRNTCLGCSREASAGLEKNKIQGHARKQIGNPNHAANRHSASALASKGACAQRSMIRAASVLNAQMKQRATKRSRSK